MTTIKINNELHEFKFIDSTHFSLRNLTVENIRPAVYHIGQFAGTKDEEKLRYLLSRNTKMERAMKEAVEGLDRAFGSLKKKVKELSGDEDFNWGHIGSLNHIAEEIRNLANH